MKKITAVTTDNQSYYQFVAEDGQLLIPFSEVILVDDESGEVSVKATASRQTILTFDKTLLNQNEE